MTRINLGQTIQTLANLGVIAGILFLGIEVQQNNELLGAQARATRTQVRLDLADAWISNPELARALLKQRNGEPLTAMDEFLLLYHAVRVLAGWQYVYGEFRAGLLDESEIPIENWRFTCSVRPEMKRALQDAGRMGLRPDFVQWMKENVVE